MQIDRYIDRQTDKAEIMTILNKYLILHKSFRDMISGDPFMHFGYIILLYFKNAKKL